MKFNRWVVLFIFVLFSVLVTQTGGAVSAKGVADRTVFAMCHPELGQIKNIEEMVEKDIIPLQRIQLIAVYHEDESDDYTEAHEYVKKNKLTWVTFRPIKGKVAVQDVYKENLWTPQFRRIFENTDGIIFTGGEDMPPVLYGEKNHLLTDAITPVRSYYEASFLFHLLGGSQNSAFVPFLESRQNYVVLGICLGCQTMNVACGGTMFQDIPAEVYKYTTVEQVLAAGSDQVHSGRYIRALYPLDTDLPPAFHRFKFKKDSVFVKGMKLKKGEEPLVLSAHHQAIEKVAKDLEVIGFSMDEKIVEAVAHKKYKNVLGVQFHPEPYRLYRKGLMFQQEPGGALDFNLRQYLEDNPPAMEFHRKFWVWFAQVLQE